MGLIGEHYMSRWEYTSYWGHVSRGRLWRSGRRHQFRSWKFLIRISQSQLDVSIVRQTEGTRPIDNYKRSGVNDATAIYSKLWLPSLDHLVEIARRMKKKTEEALAIVKMVMKMSISSFQLSRNTGNSLSLSRETPKMEDYIERFRTN